MVLVQFKDQNPAKFARQEVVRTSLGRLLTSPSYSHILVPVFQRPYCWPRNQLQPWYGNRRRRHASYVQMFNAITVVSRYIVTVVPRLDNVLHGAEIVASKGSGDIIAEVEDLDNIDEFHSVGIGRFKLTEVGQYLLSRYLLAICRWAWCVWTASRG